MEYMAAAAESGRISAGGDFGERCRAILEAELGDARVFLTPSCTSALEMAAILLNIQPGDEVIVPSFSYVSTANSFVQRGAIPVFADIRDDTFNLDESLLESLVSQRTRAVVPIHYAGVGAAMDRILEIAGRAGAAVAEDNAAGLFGRRYGRPLGAIGAMGAVSFHQTKNIACGEGGALIVNDPSLVARAEVVYEKGTNRADFLRGAAERYTWHDAGSSFAQSELHAAFLLAQLERREEIMNKRRKIWDAYYTELKGWAESGGARLPLVPEGSEQNYHEFYVLAPTAAACRSFLISMAEKGVQCADHYQPLHTSKMGKHFGGREGQCPVAESVASRLARLPFYTGMTAAEQEYVISTIIEFAM